MSNNALLETKKGKQRALFQISKQELRQLLSNARGEPLSIGTFWRLSKRMQLAEKIGMTEDEFRRARIFYLVHYERLKVIIGFTDSDILEID